MKRKIKLICMAFYKVKGNRIITGHGKFRKKSTLKKLRILQKYHLKPQRISDFSVCEALHQGKVKNPKLKGNMVIMFFIF